MIKYSTLGRYMVLQDQQPLHWSINTEEVWWCEKYDWGKKLYKWQIETVISILFSLTSISVTISLNKHNVQNHFLELAGSEKLTATWKSCIMNVNICHLQVSHSQTLIQYRTGCGKAGGRQMECTETAQTQRELLGSLTGRSSLATKKVSGK